MGVRTTYERQIRVKKNWLSGSASPGTEEKARLYCNSTEITRIELGPERRVSPRLDDMGISGCMCFFLNKRPGRRKLTWPWLLCVTDRWRNSILACIHRRQ